MKGKSRLRACAAVLVSGVVAAVLTPSHAQMRPQDMQFSLAPMLEKVIPAVVSIRVTGERYRAVEIKPVSAEQPNAAPLPAPPKEPFKAGGSGVIFDPERGLIVTNNHVIADATSIMVALADGRVFDARLVGRDVGTDVAIVRIEAANLPSVPLGDSDQLKVGDIVVAIGNPFGLEGTATMGIVSALMRSDIGYEIFEDFVQIDATINPGNSGGALVNLKGELVAINTAVAGGGRNVGIGFAIPIKLACNVGKQLTEFGKVKRGGLGLLTQNLTADLRLALQLQTSRGALVIRVVPGSPAAIAGINAGDVVVRLGGRPVRGSDDYVARVVNTPVGTSLDVEVLSDGRIKQFSLTVAELMPRPPEVPVPVEMRGLGGAVLAPILLGSPHFGELRGAEVLRVEPRSAAYEIGLKDGDVIVGVGDMTVRTPEELLQLAPAQPSSYRLNIVRQRVPGWLRVDR
jgi:serine protease DegQ